MLRQFGLRVYTAIEQVKGNPLRVALAIGRRGERKEHTAMANIHVNTDTMRQLSGSLEYWSNYLRDGMLPAIQRLTGQLEGDWQGVSRLHYDELLQQFYSETMVLINRAQELGLHLNSTATQFDSADQSM